MLVRAIALSLALLIGIGTIIPLATELRRGRAEKAETYKKEARRKYKKYSKRWWRQYRARMKRKTRACTRADVQLRLRQLRLARAREAKRTTGEAESRCREGQNRSTRQRRRCCRRAMPAPTGWKRGDVVERGELQFRVDNGEQVGSASISVVGPAMGESSTRAATDAVGGVPTTSLRREVIDRMIRENGWVVNDYQKEIGGQAGLRRRRTIAGNRRPRSIADVLFHRGRRPHLQRRDQFAGRSRRTPRRGIGKGDQFAPEPVTPGTAGMRSRNNRSVNRSGPDTLAPLDCGPHFHSQIYMSIEQQTICRIARSRFPTFFKKMTDAGGSDLHLTTNSAPQVRVHGHLAPLAGFRAADARGYQTARLFGFDRRAKAPFRRKSRARLFVRFERNVAFSCQSL